MWRLLLPNLPRAVSSAIATSSPSNFLRSGSQFEALAFKGQCETITDIDLYGTGIRIGMYLQWAAGFMLRNSECFEARPRVRTASNILASAVALATAINVFHGTALSIDYLMSYYLTVVLFYAESYILEIRDDDKAELRSQDDVQTLELHADLSLVFQNMYFTIFTLFGAWYWLRGIDSMADPVCGAKAALLFVFDIRSHVWTRAAAGLAVVGGVAFLIVFFIHVASLSDGIGSGPRLVAVYYAGVMAPLSARFVTAYSFKMWLRRILKPAFPGISSSVLQPIQFIVRLAHYFLIYLAGPLIAIVSAERMVAVNDLVTSTAFGSAGQILPLFTGIASCLLACWEIIQNYRKSRKSHQRERSITLLRGDETLTPMPAV